MDILVLLQATRLREILVALNAGELSISRIEYLVGCKAFGIKPIIFANSVRKSLLIHVWYQDLVSRDSLVALGMSVVHIRWRLG